MIEIADGLRACFELSIGALDRRRMTVEMSTRQELLDRFGEVAFIHDGNDLQRLFETSDLVLWYGMNALTPTTLQGMSRRPLSVRVVHTQKVEEGEQYHDKWRHCIDAVSCVSPVVQRRIAGSVFIPNTVSSSRLQGSRRFDLFTEPVAKKRKTLGFLGRLFEFKNIPWLIENAGPLDYNLLVQGIDTEELRRTDLEALARDCGVASQVCFLEPSWDVGSLLRSVDAVVIVSQQEGFPMVAVEAGMLGIPLISTRVGALPELFPDRILFVDLAGSRPSPDSMRDALERLEPSWGEALQDAVQALCSRQAVIDRYAELIRRVASGKVAE